MQDALHGPVLRGLLRRRSLAHIRSLAFILFIFPTTITQLSLRSHFNLACQIDLFGMHLPHLSTLVIYLFALASSSPIAWPDDKLEQINALRARGVSEVSRESQACNLPMPVLLLQTVFVTPSGLNHLSTLNVVLL